MLRKLAKKSIDRIPLKLVARHAGIVLTYHATYNSIPCHVDPVDNVTPETIHAQLRFLKNFYRFVSADEFCAAKNRKELAAVTFDDAYISVLSDALGIFTDLEIPLTIFVNIGNAGRRKVFWRHKVRFLIVNGLAGECASTMQRTKMLKGKSFHDSLKHPINDSRIVEMEIDQFLRSKNISLECSGELMSSADAIVNHPLVTYGNHTANHYVLSSLPYAVQLEEIENTKAFLRRLPSARTTEIVAAPFGSQEHVNHDTFRALRSLGYKYLFMNSGQVNRRRRMHKGIEIIERFSVLEEPIGFQLRRAIVKTFVRKGM
jgi:peptidoglycan/xylan/chitin deacetylase (PgdA/CDA1 family)